MHTHMQVMWRKEGGVRKKQQQINQKIMKNWTNTKMAKNA